MRRSRQIILTIILTITLIGVAWFAGRGRLKTPVTTILVTKHAVAAGTQLTAADLKTVTIAADLLIEGYMNDLGQADGLWTQVDLSAGEILNRSRLTRQSAGLVYPDVEPGRRLMTLELPPVDANGFWLTSGSLVDLYLIPRNSNHADGMMILEKIRIIALLGASSGGSGPLMQDPAGGASPLLCLDLSREQAELIAQCSGIYDFKLSAICSKTDQSD